MKTERMTLLIAPADKAAITARAEGLGLSVSELVRQAALGYDPEDAAIRAEVEALLPEAAAAIDRMSATFDRMIARNEEHRRRMDWMQSPEGQEQIRSDLFSNPNIDWDHIARVLETIQNRKVAA